MIPILALVVAAVSGPGRWGVILLAFAFGYIGDLIPARLPVGGAGLFVSDLLIVGAVGGLLVEMLVQPSGLRPRLPRTAILGLPLLVLFLALMVGAVRGHERYGATLVGMPLRLAGYAAIAAALPGLTPARALRGITVVVYGGAIWLSGVAAFHIATGTSATSHQDLSTGGIRYIGVTAATYAAIAFIMAVLNLSARRGRPLVHLAIALLAGFDVMVAYTRTVWLVLAVMLLIAAVASPAIRSSLLASVPVITPILVLGVLMIVTLVPNLVSTFADRISTPAGEDTSVQWRTLAYQAVLSGTSDEPALGVGFGRVTGFSLNGQPNKIEGDPHNGFIYVFAGAGIVGVTALSLLLLTYLASVASRWRRTTGEARTLLAWCLGTWILVMTHALSEPVFTNPSLVIILWISMLLPTIVGERTTAPALALLRRPALRRPVARRVVISQ